MSLAIQVAPPLEPTISDIEKIVQNGLEALRNAPLNDQITAALKFLTPPGYRPIAQLEEDGRKKRSNAAASNWTPETGEIVIYFEREVVEPNYAPNTTVPEPPSAPQGMPLAEKHERFATFNRRVEAGLREDPLRTPASERSKLTREHSMASLEEPKVSKEEIEQLCVALADAEKAGKAFISLTWFRDQELTTHGYAWAESQARRRAVLDRAFDLGAILTNRIPNPKSSYPTTTIKLNRETEYARAVAPRYQPIQLRGDGPSASEIIMRDRGRL